MDTTNKVLSATVTVTDPESGDRRRFSAGDKPTAKWAKLITNESAWEDLPPEPEAEDDDTETPRTASRKDTSAKKAGSTKTSTKKATSTKKSEPEDGNGDKSGGAPETEAPPRNASTDDWRAYSAAVGVEQPEDAGRDAIISDLEQRGLLDTE